MSVNLILSDKEMEECKVDVLYASGLIGVPLLVVAGVWHWFKSRRSGDEFMSKAWMQERLANEEE